MAAHNLKGSKALPQGLQTIDGHQLDVRNLYTLYTDVWDSKGFSAIKPTIPFLSANIVGRDVILGQMWLDVVNPQINWETNRFSICPDGGQIFKLLLRGRRPEPCKIKEPNIKDWEKISNNASFTHPEDTTHIDQAPDIALVTGDKIFEIANSQGLQTYIVKWQDLIEQDVLWEMCQTIEALTVVDNNKEQLTAKVMLPVEYEDFANVFSK